MLTHSVPLCTCRDATLVLRANDLRCLLCGKPVPVLRPPVLERQLPGASTTLLLLGAVALLGGLLGWVLAVVGR